MFKTKNNLKPPARYFNHKSKQKQFPDSSKSKKIESDLVIKPSSGYEKQIDYRFETEEEIETEEQCRKFQHKASSQKRNNSFSNSRLDLSICDDEANGKSQKERQKKERKIMDFYLCDSLSIRPSGNQKNQNKSTIDRFQSLTSSIIPKKETASQVTTQIEGTQKASKCVSLRPLLRQKRKIFDGPRLDKNKQNEQLPFALMAPQNIKQQLKRKSTAEIEDQFHIIIETDQITQCCI